MITVYSRENCTNCTKVKNWLTQAGLLYEVKDLDKDPQAMVEAQKSGLRSLPIIKYGDEEYTSGYDKKDLEYIAAID